MTLNVKQDEAIGILRNVKILPIEPIVKIKEEKNNKVVNRIYHIKEETNTYPKMDKLIIQYKVSKCTETVKDYSIFLTDGLDKVYLCKYSPKILNTLFDNVILLELSNWRRTIQRLEPLRTIDNYSSLMFDLEIDNKSMKHDLKKLVNRGASKLLNKFEEYKNTNKIIPTNVWISELCKYLEEILGIS